MECGKTDPIYRLALINTVSRHERNNQAASGGSSSKSRVGCAQRRQSLEVDEWLAEMSSSRDGYAANNTLTNWRGPCQAVAVYQPDPTEWTFAATVLRFDKLPSVRDVRTIQAGALVVLHLARNNAMVYQAADTLWVTVFCGFVPSPRPLTRPLLTWAANWTIEPDSQRAGSVVVTADDIVVHTENPPAFSNGEPFDVLLDHSSVELMPDGCGASGISTTLAMHFKDAAGFSSPCRALPVEGLVLCQFGKRVYVVKPGSDWRRAGGFECSFTAKLITFAAFPFFEKDQPRIPGLAASKVGVDDAAAPATADKFTCCLCGKECVEEESHNASPVESGRCCTACNMTVVISARLAQSFA